MKRCKLDLTAVVQWDNLISAYHQAARGKRDRADVKQFSSDIDKNLLRMSLAILQQQMPLSRYRSFLIFDPKKRLTHAACFEDRVYHHALMNIAGPVLERAMTDRSYACRTGFGVHKVAKKVQKHLQQYNYYCKIDIQSYFASINHQSTIRANRVLGGGSWINNGRNTRSAFRNSFSPDNGNNNIGCRLVQAPDVIGIGITDQIVILSGHLPCKKQGHRYASSESRSSVNACRMAAFNCQSTP